LFHLQALGEEGQVGGKVERPKCFGIVADIVPFSATTCAFIQLWAIIARFVELDAFLCSHSDVK
ncbi:hypothetical protein ACFLYR_09510, partial [Chloroflexota bacterium]